MAAVTVEGKPGDVEIGAVPDTDEKKIAPMPEPSTTLENVQVYIDMSLILAVILCGSFLFSQRDVQPGLAPFTVIVFTIIIVALTILRYQKHCVEWRTEMPTYLAAWIWLIWLVYGMMFHKVELLWGETAGHVQSSLALLLVLMTYVSKLQSELAWMHTIAGAELLLLLFPHVDTISHGMNTLLLFTKVILFYVLFTLTAVDAYYGTGEKKNNIDQVAERRWYILVLERTVIRSAWVLMVTKWLVAGSVLQFIIIGIRMRRGLQKPSSRRKRKFAGNDTVASMEEGRLTPQKQTNGTTTRPVARPASLKDLPMSTGGSGSNIFDSNTTPRTLIALAANRSSGLLPPPPSLSSTVPRIATSPYENMLADQLGSQLILDATEQKTGQHITTDSASSSIRRTPRKQSLPAKKTAPPRKSPDQLDDSNGAHRPVDG